MKNNLLTAVLTAICLIACSKEETVTTRQVTSEVIGDWHLVEETCEGIVVKDNPDIYLSINSDCTFELYQKSGTQIRFSKYEGTCYSEGDQLIGQYSDSTPWGAIYSVSFEDGHMILTSYDRLSRQKYEKKSLADEEKNNADVALKSIKGIILPKL